MRHFLELLGGSALVYVLVAACGGGAGTSGRLGDTEPDSGALGAGGQPGRGGSVSGDSGLLGDVTSPVPDAHAQDGGAPGCDCPAYVPPAPMVVEAECNVVVEGTPTMYAEAEFPGKTAADLAHVVAIARFDPERTPSYPASFAPGYSAYSGLLFVRDGFVATSCGSSQLFAESVVFILPP